MTDTFYITTPIYYVNSHPHIGHAYTTIVTDVLTRFRKLFGDDTYFLTGTDEHGQKIVESAAKADVEPQAFVDEISREFREMWPHLHIDFDQFIRTTDPEHKACVQQILQKIYDQARREGDTDIAPVIVGEAVDMVRAVQPAAQILTQMVKQAEHLLRSAPDHLS